MMNGTLKYFGFATLTNSADQFNFSDATVLVWHRFYHSTHWPKTSWRVIFEEHQFINFHINRGLSLFVPGLQIREIVRFPAYPELA